MTETTIRIALTELNVVRVTCEQCQTVVEIPLDKLAERFADGECQHCHESFHVPSTGNPFVQLAEAVRKLTEMSDRVVVHFSLPVETDAP